MGNCWLKIIAIILLLFALAINSYAEDRCVKYTKDVRSSFFYYFGVDFPYHYAIGQLKQESACRDKVTAFDAGMGVAQFMPTTVDFVSSKIGKFNPYNAKEAIKAQAYYMSYLHKQNWDGRLWLTFQAYNGGWRLLKSESIKAKTTNWQKMRNVCNRKVITLKNGNLLDFCFVNYDYSCKIYKYGKEYKLFNDKMRYW
jgi:hypothetical protein